MGSKMKKYNKDGNKSGLLGMPPAFICNINDAMPNKNKRYRMKLHSIKRARQRYGIWLKGSDLINISRSIFYGKSLVLKSFNDHCLKCLINYKGNRFLVIYDKNEGMTRTFLTPETT